MHWLGICDNHSIYLVVLLKKLMLLASGMASSHHSSSAQGTWKPLATCCLELTCRVQKLQRIITNMWWYPWYSKWSYPDDHLAPKSRKWLIVHISRHVSLYCRRLVKLKHNLMVVLLSLAMAVKKAHSIQTRLKRSSLCLLSLWVRGVFCGLRFPSPNPARDHRTLQMTPLSYRPEVHCWGKLSTQDAIDFVPHWNKNYRAFVGTLQRSILLLNIASSTQKLWYFSCQWKAVSMQSPARLEANRRGSAISLSGGDSPSLRSGRWWAAGRARQMLLWLWSRRHKLGSTLLNPPLSRVGLHRQESSVRQANFNFRGKIMYMFISSSSSSSLPIVLPC